MPGGRESVLGWPWACKRNWVAEGGSYVVMEKFCISVTMVGM